MAYPGPPYQGQWDAQGYPVPQYDPYGGYPPPYPPPPGGVYPPPPPQQPQEHYPYPPPPAYSYPGYPPAPQPTTYQQPPQQQYPAQQPPVATTSQDRPIGHVPPPQTVAKPKKPSSTNSSNNNNNNTSSTPASVPPLATAPQTPPPKDPKGHTLEWAKQKYKGKYLCDVCKGPSTDTMCRWVCFTCQYDMCPACHPAPGAPPRPKCKKGHQVKWGVQKYPQGEYSCDKCKTLHGTAERRWICETCQYDLCTMCHPMPFPPGAGNFSPRPPRPQQQQQQQQQQQAPLRPPQSAPVAPAVDYAPATPVIDNSVWIPPAPEYAASLPPVKVDSYGQSGRRKALVIGINYLKNPRAKLDGCINDARNLQYFLSQHKFPTDKIILLTDDTDNPEYMPNRANLLKWMEWLVKDTKPGDSLWFSFSGHGSQVKDENGDEADGMDETILPVDYATAGPIIDDDLYRILVLSLPRGVRLTGIMDCCHSGTGMDLPIVYDGTVARDAEEYDITRGILRRSHHDIPRQVKSRGLSDPPLAIIFSGCEDAQTSADATGLAKPGIATGALTFLFLDILGKNPNITFDGIMQELRRTLKQKGFTQIPQLSYNVPFNLTGKFCL